MVLPEPLPSGGRGGGGIPEPAAHPPENCHGLRSGRGSGQLGRTAVRHAGQGLHQSGAAGRRAGGAESEGPAVRQVPKPAHVPSGGRAGGDRGLRRSGAGQIRA